MTSISRRDNLPAQMPITDYYVTTDAMGSVMAVLDETGNVLERRSYDAFGEATYMLPDGTVVPDSPTGVDIGFQGQLMDKLTGLYQMGFRWYSPVLGRWVSRDPIGLEGGVNPTVFAGNKPSMHSDERGLQAGSVAVTVIPAGTPTITSLQHPEILTVIAATRNISIAMLLRKIALCELLYNSYHSLDCRKCNLVTTKEEACERAECFAKEIAFREKYLMENCDYFLPGSFMSDVGSDGKVKSHRNAIAEKYNALEKCAEKCCH